MSRFATLSLFTLLACGVLAAQEDQAEFATASPEESNAQPVVIEMDVERSLKADNGVDDIFDSVVADKLVLRYQLVNDTREDISLEPKVAISEEAYCTAIVTELPDEHVAAGESTTMVIEVKPEYDGPFSFRVNMGVDDREYSFQVQATVIALLHGSRHHCHWWGCHDHHHGHDHHCSTSDGAGWALFAALGATIGLFAYRRVRRA